VSILLIKSIKFNPEKRNTCRIIKKPKNYREDTYIDDVSDKTQFGSKKLVGIDPGKEDLIYCTNGEIREIEKNGKIKHKVTTFRYSQNQRRFETCHKVPPACLAFLVFCARYRAPCSSMERPGCS